MSSAIDYAKFFIKNGLDSNHNTYDGNMKLQKLLFFADFISLVERDTLLFSEPVRAFSNGCVIEEVRLRYKDDYDGLYADSREFELVLSPEEYDVLNLTQELFGRLSAKELSELNHTFEFWKTALARSTNESGFHDKDLAIVSTTDMMKEKDKLKQVIEKFRANKSCRELSELINGVRFYYAPDFQMSDSVLSDLEEFSMTADDSSYSIYIENGSLVIL